MRREKIELKSMKLNGNTTRRGFVKGMGVAAVGAGAASLTAAAPACATALPNRDAPRQGLRFAFLSDLHLRREYDAARGIAACLRAVEALDPRPDFIMTGGDLCHDLRGEDLDDARRLADQFVRIWSENTSIPTYHMLGNHDPAGWGDGDVPEDHPDFAFGLMQRVLDLEERYYSFDEGDWHFVVLDNNYLTEPGSHIGWVDDEQLAWLRQDLERNSNRPTIVGMHVPPITAIEFLSDRRERDTDENEWRIGFDRKSGNPQDLIDVLDEGDVRAVLSGHIHVVERIDLMDHSFLCLGSVSGQQWMGPRLDMGTAEGFGVLDLSADGSFEWSYETFGWQASEEARSAQEG